MLLPAWMIKQRKHPEIFGYEHEQLLYYDYDVLYKENDFF